MGTTSIADIAAELPPASGVVYVVGNTNSVNFPIKNDYQGALAGSTDAFVAKIDLNSLNPEQPCVFSPSAIVYEDCDDLLSSTYIGGSSFDAGHGIARNTTNQVYITGQTCSNDFPTQSGVFDISANGGCDAFLTSLSLPPVGSISLTYSTYIGGTGSDLGRGIVRSPVGGAVVITGETASVDFPLKGPAQVQHGGGQFDAFVARISPIKFNTNDPCPISGLDYSDCADLLGSTFLGGSGDDYGHSVATDIAGTAYVTGQTCSGDFPLEAPLPQDAVQGKNVGSGCDAFVSKFNPSGSALAYSTYFGGSSSDSGSGIFVDQLGNAHVAGATSSGNFPEESPLQAAGGGEDAFVARITEPCVNGGGAFAYVGANVVDTASDCLVGDIPGTSKNGQAVSPDGAEVYTAFSTTVSFINPVSDQVVPVTPPLAVALRGAAVSPDGTRLYVSDHADGFPSYVHVFNAQTKQFIESIPFGEDDPNESWGASGVVVHPNGNKLYVVVAHPPGGLYVLNLAAKQYTLIPLDNVTNFQSWGIAITPDGNWVYVANGPMNDSVSVINANTDTWVKNLTIENANWVAITPEKVSTSNDYLVYVTAIFSSDLTVIDNGIQDIVHTEPGAGGRGLQVTPDGKKVYVSNGTLREGYRCTH